MRIFLGISMGLISALVLALIGLMTFGGKGDAAAGLAVLAFVAGWPLSSWLFLRKAPTGAHVAARAFLTGTFEWLIVIFAGWLMVVQTNERMAKEPYGGYAAIASGAAAQTVPTLAFIAAVSITFSIACLIGYFIAKSSIRRHTLAPLPESNE